MSDGPVIRPARESDLPFVWHSMLASIQERIPYRFADKRLFHVEMTARIKALVERSSVLVACDTEDEDVIFGFVVTEGDVLHFVYVKFAFTSLGIARQLVVSALPHVGSRETTISVLPGRKKDQETTTGATLAKYRLVFNPFLLEKPQ